VKAALYIIILLALTVLHPGISLAVALYLLFARWVGSKLKRNQPPARVYPVAPQIAVSPFVAPQPRSRADELEQRILRVVER
jgi:hypothetical protein